MMLQSKNSLWSKGLKRNCRGENAHLFISSVVRRSEILRAMFGPLQDFWGPFEFFYLGPYITNSETQPCTLIFTKAELVQIICPQNYVFTDVFS